MSIESWKQEFYPIHADQTPIEQAITHSLQKWIGLRAENLARHNCRVAEHGAGIPYIEEMNDEPFQAKEAVCIMSDTCALCHHYLLEIGEYENYCCEKCPLAKHLGYSCDGGSKFKGQSRPYATWYDTGNPEIMISALQATLESHNAATQQQST